MSFAITNYHLSYREKVIYPRKKVLSFVHPQKPVEFICPKKICGEICMESTWQYPLFQLKVAKRIFNTRTHIYASSCTTFLKSIAFEHFTSISSIPTPLLLQLLGVRTQLGGATMGQTSKNIFSWDFGLTVIFHILHGHENIYRKYL